MKKLPLVFALACLPLLGGAQGYDHQWPMGSKLTNNPAVFGISMLDFTQQPLALYAYDTVSYPVRLGSGGSFVCGPDGQLLLTTNNCAVFDRDFVMVPGTDTLAPGASYLAHCPWGYPNSQISLLLPHPANDSLFYALNKDTELSDSLQALTSRHLYLTVVARLPNGGFAAAGKKKLLDLQMIPGKLTACIHRDGDKWWTWTADFHSNTMYKFLIGGPDTVQGPFLQQIGERIRAVDNGGIGQTSFSPDGSKLGLLTADRKLLLYDFDNETGEFSNYRAWPVAPDDPGTGRGLGFSPDSRLAYVSTVEHLYQVDLQDSTVQHIAHHLSYDEDGWPVGIGRMHLGPDCRLYLSPGSTTYYIHVVHHPGLKGEACGFEARALRAPTNISFHFPNLPMYRFGGACDSTIQFPAFPPVASFTVSQDGFDAAFTDTSQPAAAAWQWDFGDGGTSGEQHPLHTYPANGTYTACLTASNADGSGAQCREVEVSVNGAGEAERAGRVRVLPNPASREVTVWLEGSTDDGTVSIVDMMGKTLAAQVLDGGGRKVSFDVADLPGGLYMIKWAGSKGVVRAEKLVVRE